MTRLIATYVLVGMDALMLAGGVWLLAHAIKTLRAEELKTKAGIGDREPRHLTKALSAPNSLRGMSR